MYKAYKFRLYPSSNQKILIHKTFGCIRLVYNYYLNETIKNGYRSSYDNIKDYNENLKLKKPFLKEVDSTSIQKVIFNLDDNLKKYYKSNFGYPKFKSKYDKNSFTTNCLYGKYKDKRYANIEIDLQNKTIKLPKLGKVKIRGYRNIKSIDGRIINSTISREKNGKYYVSVLMEIKEKENVLPKNIVGIDLGIKELVTLSDGTNYENNRYIKKYEKRIKKVQAKLSKKQKKSNNYFKCKQKLNVLYSKLYNARKYYIHKITKEITDNNDIICAEDLNTKEMIMKKELSKSIADASFYEILRELKYKAKEKGKYFYQINPYYASSQICSRCDHKDIKYKNLNERIYECINCKNTIDRDLNASINIVFEGLKLFVIEKFA